MPRNLPLGNGSLLIAFDQNYLIREVFYPHVGQNNHSLGHPFRMGVWVDGNFRWLDDGGWTRNLLNQDQTIIANVELIHPDLDIEINASEAVDFHENLFLRRFTIKIPSGKAREVRLFFHHDFHIDQNEVGDISYFEPQRRAVYHYKGNN